MPIVLSLFYHSNDKDLKLWGDEILADMPPCLGGEDNRINVA